MKRIVLAAISIVMLSAIGAHATTMLTANINVNAEVITLCQEAQHGAFPNPLLIDPQTATDQSFPPSADELIKCSNGVVFTVKISSANGSAIDQICTSSGVSTMALKSVSWPSDMIAYTFMCAGDTDGSGHFTGGGYNITKALGISIKVLAANAQAALAHNDYSDTVTVTLTY